MNMKWTFSFSSFWLLCSEFVTGLCKEMKRKYAYADKENKS